MKYFISMTIPSDNNELHQLEVYVYGEKNNIDGIIEEAVLNARGISSKDVEFLLPDWKIRNSIIVNVLTRLG